MVRQLEVLSADLAAVDSEIAVETCFMFQQPCLGGVGFVAVFADVRPAVGRTDVVTMLVVEVILEELKKIDNIDDLFSS